MRANNMLSYGFGNGVDPFHDSDFLTPIEWLADIATPDGRTPPIDDGNKAPINANLLSWKEPYGDPTLGKKFAYIRDATSASRIGADRDYRLVEIAIPLVEQGGGTPIPSTGIQGNLSKSSLVSQQVIARDTYQGKKYYIFLNGEHGDAITRGEGHEQPDQLQLLFYVDGRSYLMDTGYDESHPLTNSTWNKFDDHNVLYPNGTALQPPYVDPIKKRKVSDFASVEYNYAQDMGDIVTMQGAVPIQGTALDGSVYYADYERNILYLKNDATNNVAPYLIDINAHVLNVQDSGSGEEAGVCTLQYFSDTINEQADPYGWSEFAYPDNNNLYIYKTFLGSSILNRYFQDGNNYELRELPGNNYAASYIRDGGTILSKDKAYISILKIGNSKPATPSILNSVNRDYYGAFSLKENTNTVDVIIKRLKPQGIGSTDSFYNSDISVTVPDAGDAELSLPGGDDYGFARLTQENGVWVIDPNYQINLTRIDFVYPSNTSISTKTYPSNADIWIGNNVTLTVTGTMSLQPGTTVHLGVGSVIQTTGSGNIQATSTVFKTLTGSTSASQRWLHIILEGNGGSTFTQCTFNGASQAIYVDSQGNTVDRCTFQYNSCGLYAWTGSVYIDGSTFNNNPDYGIYEGGTGYAQLYGYQYGSTFIPNTISNSYYGVNIYDNAWAVLKNTQVDNNTYGAINYGSTMLQTGNHSDSGGCPAYVGYGWNRFSLNSSYAIYNGSSQTDYANDNWWGSVSGPSTSNLYGSVNYADYLNYDPTINGGPQTGSCGSGGGCPPTCTIAQAVATKVQAMNAGTQGTDSSSTQSPVVSLTSTSTTTQGGVSGRLTSIYGQLAKNPGASDNYRLLQEAYQLVQMDDPADTTSLLRELDSYTGQFNTAINQASGVISTGSKPPASNTIISPILSQTTLRMGSTAVLLKMDYLLHKEKWGQAQNLADQFAQYFQNSKNESSFLASRAVAWEHQKQFAEALAAYQQIDNLQPKSPPAGYVAPDYSFIEAELKDSVKVYGQSPVASQEAGQSESAMKGNQELPKKFSVGDSYPNPFNPTTIIPISLPKAAHVRVVVYNVVGQQVATLANRAFQAGTYQLRFNADQLASGVYFIRARLGEKLFTTRVTLIK